MTTTGAGQNGGGVTKTRGTNGTGHGGAMVTTGTGMGSPKWNPNETPARAGAANSVVIPMTANPNKTCFFIVARFDGGFRPRFRIRALIVDQGPSGASMKGRRRPR